MPSPPTAGESQSDFVGRCIPYMIREHKKEQKQAVAMCYSMWRSRGKTKRKAAKQKARTKR